MLKFHFQPDGGQISLFQAPQWLLTVPKVVLGKSEDTVLTEINHTILQVYSIANTYFCIKISYSKACILIFSLSSTLFALKVQLQLSCAILTWQRTPGDLSLLAFHINNDKWSSHPNKMKSNTLFEWALDYCYGAHETSLPDQHFVLAWSNWREKASLFVVIRIIIYLCWLEFQGFLDMDDEISIKCTLQQYRQDFYKGKRSRCHPGRVL